MKKFLVIIVTAIISSVIFSFLWGLLLYKPADYNHFYSFIYDIFFSGVIYFITPFIIGGIIGVVIMDKASKSLTLFKKHYYLACLALYIIGGLIISFLCLIFSIGAYIIVSPFISSLFLAIGIIGSVLFLHLYLLARKVLKIR